jgi:hypothetical protein
VQIVNHVIDDLQLEINHSRRVLIDGNVVNRAVKTAAIGIFSAGDNAIEPRQYDDYLRSRYSRIDCRCSVWRAPPCEAQSRS